MEKIFYAKRSEYAKSDDAVKKILRERFNIENAVIVRSESGKPYLSNARELSLFFSVSHTDETLFVAVSDQNVGIDAELLSRKVEYAPIVGKFDERERNEIRTKEDFLRHFTAKESAVKWLGGTLAHDLRALRYTQGRMIYQEVELPAYLAFPTFNGYVVAVCADRDFSDAEFIAF